MADIQKTFLYNAHGSALGGFITRPFNEVIESVASVSLPVSGGYGSAEVKNYDYHQLIKFDRAYTQVSGSQAEDGSYNTLISVIVEGLTVAAMITAERIVARITTKHDGAAGETRVVPTGSEFVDLRIAGEPVGGLECDPMLTELDTYEAFKKKSGKQESRGMIRCSLARNIKHSRMKQQDDQTVIVVPDFGTVYLGECYMATSQRKLTMMRLQLGSPVAGAVALGDGAGNGLPFP
jgi:hypothetical protein